MPEGYLYDVFISYRHRQPMHDWVYHHFQPLLQQWLPDFMPYDPSIFIDLNIEAGVEWPAKLRQALLMSRCLLAVWSPQYFRSKWCLAELQAMLQREQQLGLRSDQNPSGLIYAVLYNGAEYLPPDVRAIQYRDLSKWNAPYPVFQETTRFLEFDSQMQLLCQELSKMIQSAPPWQASWPVVTSDISPTFPSETPSITFELLRLR